MPSDNRLSLTPSERFTVERRRRGLNQSQMARELGLALSRYSLVERGVVDPPKAPPALGVLRPHERCFIYRRRAGVTQAEVAKELKYCRFTVHEMERGERDCTDLLCYWES